MILIVKDQHGPDNKIFRQIDETPANIYDQLTEQDLQSKIEDIENTNQQHRHAKCWKLINSITERKKRKKGIIKAKN